MAHAENVTSVDTLFNIRTLNRAAGRLDEAKTLEEYRLRTLSDVWRLLVRHEIDLTAQDARMRIPAPNGSRDEYTEWYPVPPRRANNWHLTGDETVVRERGVTPPAAYVIEKVEENLVYFKMTDDAMCAEYVAPTDGFTFLSEPRATSPESPEAT